MWIYLLKVLLLSLTVDFVCVFNMFQNVKYHKINQGVTRKKRSDAILCLCSCFVDVFVYLFLFVISRPACRREIIICTMRVCTCMRESVTHFSLKLLQLHIFGKLLVLMNFYALQYFLGLVNFGLFLSE